MAYVSHAQYTSIKGYFNVDNIRGCAGVTINILNANLKTSNQCTDSNHPCIIGSSGSTPLPSQNVFSFTFNKAGTYYLVVKYQTIEPDSIKITVDPNTPPPFDIYTCANDKVEINITDKTYDSYNIDFNGDGTIDSSIPSGNNQTVIWSYPSAYNGNISVKGLRLNTANNCSPDVQPFQTLLTLPTPQLNSLTAIDASNLQLLFIDKTNIEYKAKIAINNSTTFQTYKTLYAVDTMNATNLTLDNNYYCFQLNSYDPCANTYTPAAPICSQKFDLNIANGENDLSWQTSSLGVSNIQIKRNNTTLTSVSATTASYNDLNIYCKKNYCYQLISNYGGGVISTSLQKCGTSFHTLTPSGIDNTSITVDGSKADLVWSLSSTDSASSYSIFRSENLLTTTTNQQYTDNSFSNGSCYQINYTDNCGNASAKGLQACAITLNGGEDNSNNIDLSWSTYKGWNQGVKEYTIEEYDTQGNLIQTINAGTDSTYTITQHDLTNQIVYYKIIATANKSGVTESISNEIRIEKNVHLYSPTAFNPDSKTSVNRTFDVKGFYISKMTLSIFDRWGSMVFYSDSNEAWDGKRDGIAMPDATYVWRAEGTDQAGNSFKKIGTVVLIRK
jgi:gliding motility-associated-like protein